MTDLSPGAPWGFLPLVLLAAAYVAICLGRAAFPAARAGERLCGGVVLALAGFTAGMQLLAYLGWVRPWILACSLLAAVAGAHVLARGARPLGVRRGFAEFLGERSAFGVWLVAASALVVVLLSAYWLPVWQWDSLGYHLPFVNFVLQDGGLRGLPRDVPYLSTYPRNVELLFVALRACLPDDRLIDTAQIPFGLAGSAAVAAIARELGARRTDAAIAGALWLLVPAVFLQLPTDYIDVATSAYFLLAAFFVLLRPTRATLLCGGLAIGLFLGTKPSAPPAAALLAVALSVRGFRAAEGRWSMLAVLLAGMLGLEAYVTNLVRHANPVWPASIDFGPLHLPGTISMRELLSSGAGAPKVYGTMPERVLRSWTALRAAPAFDMRVGGMSLLFWAGLPLALAEVVMRRRFVLAVLLLGGMLTPDPAVARYVLAVPGLVLAAALASLASMPRAVRSGVHVVLAVLGASNLVYAAPGLTGEGPPLFAYRKLTWQERERAVGANGTPAEVVDARSRLRRGETAVYDRSLWLPYSMWRCDLGHRVVRVPDDATAEDARRVLQAPEVRLVAAGIGSALERAIALDPTRHRVLFRCKGPCVVYWYH